MTEEKIFEFLLQKQYDYPKLHSEASTIIANNFTDIIYDSLKLKSSSPTNKRLNILKFLKSIACNQHDHFNINETNYSTFIESFKHNFAQTPDEDLTNFITQIGEELREKLPGNLSAEVQLFYTRKTDKHRNKIKALELIKKYDQEALDQANFPSRATKKISYYETSPAIIKKLLPSEQQVITIQPNNFTTLKYREKQIKFAYALVHFGDWITLQQVLVQLKKYKTLASFEINFLNYLNESIGGDSEHLRQILVRDFICIYEKLILQVCTEIIQLEAEEVSNFLTTLSHERKFVVIKRLCEDQTFRLKLKHLLYELYNYSFCNSNLLQFVDFLFE